MNKFSPKALEGLRHIGIKPFPILYVREKSGKQPVKPITLIFAMEEALGNNEQLLIFRGENDKLKNVTNITKHSIEGKCCTIELEHFCFVFVEQLLTAVAG